jgi:hypothetical protein
MRSYLSLLFLAALVLAAPCAEAQVLYGTLLGNITDPSQSAVPKAVVTATNKSTGLVREVSSDDRGFYAFRDLIEGSYDLKVTAQGFTTYTSTGIDIRVNATTRIDVPLQVGAVTETVTVSGQLVTLQTDKADVHVEISSREVTNLPISGYRNYQSLINLVPGATPARFQNAITDTPARALTTNINGTARNTMNTRIDGATSVHTWLPHHTHYIPPTESIETVNVATNNFDAEQGLAGGAAITVTTKSGTNDLHGALFEFWDNHKFGAKNFFFRDPKTPKNIQNQYGAALGGPIKRDRMFFFASWEGLKQRQNFGRFATVSTQAQRDGDFSGFSNANIYDPMTGAANGTGRTAFPDKRIPLARQSAIARRIQALVPLPNQTGTASNLFSSAPLVFDRDSVDGKLNWNLSSRTTMFAKYSIMISPVSCRGMLGEAVGACPVSGGGNAAGVGTGYNNTQVAGVGFNHTLTPTFLIDANWGGTWMHHDTQGPDYGRNIGSEVLGIPGTNGPDIRQSGFPIIGVNSYETLGNPNTWSPVERNDRVYTYVANASWTRNSHNLRFGVDIIKHQMNHWQPEQGGWSPRGAVNFNTGPTSLSGGPASNQFNSYASFLLGLMSTHGKALQFYDPMKTREWQYGLYVRDQWQVTRNFTATLGVRWEYFALMHRDEFGIERYDPDTDKMLLGGRGNVPRNAGTTTQKFNFAPRVGFAYRLGDKTVIRTGYGITFDPYPMSRPMRSPFPAIVRNEFNAPSSFQWSGVLEQGIPPFPAFDVSSGVVDLPRSIATTSLQPGLYRRGYIQSYNFMVQRQLPAGFTGQLGYVGTHSVRLGVSTFNINAGLIPGAGNNGRPLVSRFGRSVDIGMYIPMANSTYNSLQFKLDRRFQGGLFSTLSYTWSKTMGITAGNSDSGLSIYIPSEFHRNRRVTDFDRTHVLQGGVLWELPFGRGKRYAQDGAANVLLGGWQINGIYALYTGTPFTVTASGTSLNVPGTTQVADQVKPTVEKLGGVGIGQSFFDRTAYASVREVRMGTSALGGLRGPGVVNFDLSVFRNFKASERFNIQFRAEAFNFANTPHFDNPNASVEATNFTYITSALYDQRVVRFALRVGF